MNHIQLILKVLSAEMKAVVEKRLEGNPNFKALRLSYNFHKDDRFTTYLRQCAETEWR